MRRGNILLVILITAGVVAASVGGYFWRQKSVINQNITSVIPKSPEQENPERICTKANDCVLAIKTKACCACPTSINEKFLGKDNWESYVKGKDYNNETGCSGLNCKPCASEGQTICKIGKDEIIGRCERSDQLFPL